MKILVIGGMHGNEPLGLAVVEAFQDQPTRNVCAILANIAAVRDNRRYVKTDLNRSFPGDNASRDYEIRRAAELLELCGDYDLVLDFHNTHCPDNDCGFVGENASGALYGVANFLGLTRVIIADYDCINKFAPNCLSVEISLASQKFDVELWRKKITELAAFSNPNKIPAADVEKYRFVYRMTLNDRDKLGLEQQNLRAFEPIERNLAGAMGVTSPAFPIFVADKYTPDNFGGLLNKI